MFQIMMHSSTSIIDDLGGTSAVARLLSTPISTVHSWRRNGIPQSRMAHLKLAAEAAGKVLPVEAGLAEGRADHVATDTIVPRAPSPGNADEVSAPVAA